MIFESILKLRTKILQNPYITSLLQTKIFKKTGNIISIKWSKSFTLYIFPVNLLKDETNSARGMFNILCDLKKKKCIVRENF